MSTRIAPALPALVLVLALGATAEEAPLRATRADLARAYLRFEQTLGDHPVEGAQAARVSDAFDAATTSFFLGQTARVVEALDALSLSLLPAGEREAGLARAAAVKVTVEPLVWTRARDDRPHARAALLYAPADEAPLALRVRKAGGDGATIAQRPLALDGPPAPLPLGEGRLAPGTYAVEVVTPSGRALEKTRFLVVERALGDLRAEHEARLDAALAAHPALADTIAAARSRNALLDDDPPEDASTTLLLLDTGLAGQVAAEVATLEAGRNPYAGRAGDLWRTLPHGSRTLAVRQWVPAATEEGTQERFAVLVALHGMGADEHAFHEGYGAGRLRQLAAEKRFVLVTARTPEVIADASALERILDVLEAEQPIDRARVYVLGHSMGAGAARALAARRPDLVRAGCSIAGGGGTPRSEEVPFLVVVGGRDRIAGFGQRPRPREEAEGVHAVLVFPDLGHTLVVPAALPGAVAWLLAR